MKHLEEKTSVEFIEQADMFSNEEMSKVFGGTADEEPSCSCKCGFNIIQKNKEK